MARGPTKAKTYYVDDVVLLLMRGGFSKVEETLLAEGRGEAVIRQRMEFQEVMLDRFREVVEGETGRKVVAFMSGSHQDPDVTSEVFVLDTTDLIEGEPDDTSADLGCGPPESPCVTSVGERASLNPTGRLNMVDPSGGNRPRQD